MCYVCKRATQLLQVLVVFHQLWQEMSIIDEEEEEAASKSSTVLVSPDQRGGVMSQSLLRGDAAGENHLAPCEQGETSVTTDMGKDDDDSNSSESSSESDEDDL